MEVPPGLDPTNSRGPMLVGVTSFVLSVAFVAVSLRIYVRTCLIRQVGMDDWASVIAFVNVKNGLGRHVYFLTPEQIKNYMRTFYVTIVFYNAALAGIKMTFLFQYYRVLAVQKMKKVFIAAMIIVGAWSVSQILIAVFNCSPIPAFWDKSIDGSCIPNYPYFYINAAGNIITDIIHNGYSHNTGNTSKHRDLEVGGVPGMPGRYSISMPKRRTGSTDSEADLYDMTTYDLSHMSSDREGERSILGPGVIERQESQGEGSPSPTRRQKPIEMKRFRNHNVAVVETHIEAGPRVSDDKVKLKPGAPIEVTCDIVQVSSQK
ncbi:hypothetical protein CSHISOI_09012, partial [Colletotrichum shisoi]